MTADQTFLSPPCSNEVLMHADPQLGIWELILFMTSYFSFDPVCKVWRKGSEKLPVWAFSGCILNPRAGMWLIS